MTTTGLAFTGLNALLLVVNLVLLTRSYRAGRLRDRREMVIQGTLFGVALTAMLASIGLSIA